MILSKKITGITFESIIAACAFIIVGVMLLVMGNIVFGGIGHVTWEFLSGSPTNGMTEGGIFPAIFGTVLLVLVMSIAVIPIGTITAIYMAEYVNNDSFIARSVRFSVNTLAGIPSIVFGLFGLGFFIQFVGGGMDKMFLSDGNLIFGKPSLLWASLTMALLTLPVVIVSVEESLKTVPREQREASLALGASKFGTIVRVVLPQSISGILTGGILAISRGAGEVAPILFTGACYFLPELPQSITDQFMELGYHVFIMSTQSTNVDETRGIQYATTLVLLLLTFALNFSALLLRYQMRKRFKAA